MIKQILIVLFIAICGNTYAQSSADNKGIVKENPVSIGQERSITISLSKLKNDPVLRMPEVNKDYHITSYQVSYMPKGKGRDVWGPFLIKGNDMTTGNAASILSKAQPGDRIFFEEIVAMSEDATKQPLKLAASIKIQ